MKFLLSPSQLDDALRRGGWYIVIGFPVLVLAVATKHGPTITPMMATALGAACGTFDHWRRERGLWMLAIVFLAMFLPIYLAFAALELFASKSELTVMQVIDFAMATAVLGKLCRLLVSVAVQNWRIHRSRQEDAPA